MQDILYSADRLALYRWRAAPGLFASLWSAKIKRRLPSGARRLDTAYQRISAAAGAGCELHAAAKLYAQEYHTVEKTLEASRGAAERIACARIPYMAQGEFCGLPRAYAIAATIVEVSGGELTDDVIGSFLTQLGRACPLMMDELAVLPECLALAVLSSLADEAELIAHTVREMEKAERTAVELMAADESAKRVSLLEKSGVARDQAGVMRLLTVLSDRDAISAASDVNFMLSMTDRDSEQMIRAELAAEGESAQRTQMLILALRYIDRMDMEERLETWSGAQQSLLCDDIYRRMDKASRAHVRSAVKRLSKRLKVAEQVICRTAVKLSQESGAATACEYITGGKTAILMSSLRPETEWRELSDRARLSLMTAAELLLSAILALPALFCGVLPYLFALLPAWAVSRRICARAALMLVPMRHIPRLTVESSASINTIVAIPVLICSEKDMQSAFRRLETHYAANPAEYAVFAVVSDLPDAERAELEGEDKLLSLGVKLAQELNARYPRETPAFYLLHRRREHTGDGRFMGRERKRGALMELCRFALTGEAGAFTVVSSPLPDGIAYCVTLDADTVLPIGALGELVGAMLHPMNKPETNADGVVIKGHGMIAPAMRSTARSRAKTRFTRIFTGAYGCDSYQTAYHELYQDVFGEGIFAGKGIFDIRIYYDTLSRRIPAGAVLSHDLLEGCFLRAGFMSDVRLYDGEPETYIKWQKRRHRWIRGDWQLLPFTGSMLPDASGTPCANPLSRLSRHKMRMSIASSLVPVYCMAALISGAACSCAWSAVIALLSVSDGLVWDILRAIPGRISGFAARMKALLAPLLRFAVTLGTLPYFAVSAADAALRTLYRLYRSHRNLLEWTTAANTSGGRPAVYQLVLCALLPALIGVIAAFYHAWGFVALALFMLLFPVAIPYIDKPVPPVSVFTAADREYLLSCARCIWEWFASSMTAETNYLPPDNTQVEPKKPPCRTTSPTNIGMGLIACLSAFKLDIIDKTEFCSRVCKTLDTVEKLDKWRGNPYNWYNVSDISPAPPLYVSSVDSGNLSACLIAMWGALFELGEHDTAERCRVLAADADLSAFYDERRGLLHIGFDASLGRLTDSWYDMLASEARTAYLAAIAMGQIPARSFARLSRLLTAASGEPCLVSWSGTMFEYLMPVLFTGITPGTLLGESALAAVRAQMSYGVSDAPWGVSESGYFAFDRQMYYQYRAFGVPGLALAPSREREYVCAPYAVMLALMTDPRSAADGLYEFERVGARGRFGFYEAVDYTPERAGGGAVVKSYMAHHQGMSIAAIANALTDGSIADSFMGTAVMRAAETLLDEPMPSEALILRRYASSALSPAPAEKGISAAPRTVSSLHAVPETQSLTNGTYSCMLLEHGASLEKCGDTLITPVSDGLQCFIGDGVDTFSMGCGRDGTVLHLTPSCVTVSRHTGDLSCVLKTWVSPQQNCSLRELTLTNRAPSAKKLQVGFACGIALAPAREYEAHPSFCRLKVDARRDGDTLILYRRTQFGRPEPSVYVRLVTDGQAMFSTDGLNMPGRLRPPIDVMARPMVCDASIEAPIEPYMTVRTELTVPPVGSVSLWFIMGFADSQEEASRHAKDAYSSREAVPALAAAGAPQTAFSALFERIMARTALSIPDKRDAQLSVSSIGELWRMGISGDEPIVLLRVARYAHIRMARTLIEACRYAMGRGYPFTLVLLGEYEAAYQNDVRTRLSELMATLVCPNALHIHAYDAGEAGINALRAACTVECDRDRGLYAQFAPRSAAPYGLFVPSARSALAPETPSLSPVCGLGGFDAVSGEYVIQLKAGETTPLPWSNILTGARIGTLVTESGGGFSWTVNSRLARITPWHDDPQSDTSGEGAVICDMEERSSFSPYPGATGGPWTVRHGFGHSTFTSTASELIVTASVLVHPYDAEKYILFTLGNPVLKKRRLRVIYHARLCLGDFAHPERIRTEITRSGICGTELLSGKRASLSCDREAAYCADMDAIARGGLFSDKLKPSAGLGLDCLIAAVDVVLEPGQTSKLVFRLSDGMPARPSVKAAEKALSMQRSIWKERLSVPYVSDDPTLDLLASKWLPYQIYSSRLEAKCGYYQCGGATGFRDQLQDMLYIMRHDPKSARQHILLCASKQFPAGDVLHWWHGESHGVRTRISDDRLFLVYVACEYARVTKDASIWEEEAAFLADLPIPDGRETLYTDFAASGERASLLTHCIKAVDISMVFGQRGLPLMGGGDWNDGMDKVGGESVWLGMFLYECLMRFAPVLCSHGMNDKSKEYEAVAERLKRDIEDKAWDGAWYARAFAHDGSVIGGGTAIDCIPQAWAAITGMKNADKAMDSLMQLLVDEENGILKLLTPPYGNGKHMGYIEEYLPGVRENGGQYTHAACWVVMGLTKLGRHDDARRLIRMLLPTSHTMTPQAVKRYKGEPYVLAGDVYSVGRNAGRAGWTWYTGAAAMLLLAIEAEYGSL